MSDISDQSGYSSDEDKYDDRLDYEVSSSSDHDDSQDDGGGSEEESPHAASNADEDALDLTNLKLCHTHKAGDMVRSCTTCAAALALISDKSKIKLLTKDGQKDDFVNKFKGRCDDVVPTMDLDESTIEVATEVFSKGQFRDKRVWIDTVKNFLTLPQEVHQSLSIDFKLEDYLERLKREKRFSHVFKYRQDLTMCLKNLRIAQRPVFSLAQQINVDISRVKSIGVSSGLKYPGTAPVRSGGNVPRDARVIRDELQASSAEHVFMKPDVSQFCEDFGLSAEAMEALGQIFDEYRADASDKFVKLYNAASESLNQTDDKIIFYLDLYSHADACLRDMLRDKMASLFRQDVKTDLLTQSGSRKSHDKPTGLFGGKLYYYFHTLFITSFPKLFI